MVYYIKCNYAGCPSTKQSSPNKTFFRVPMDRNRLQLWLKAMGRVNVCEQDPKPLRKYLFVCANHFPEKCFTSTLRKQLHQTPEVCPVPWNEANMETVGSEKKRGSEDQNGDLEEARKRLRSSEEQGQGTAQELSTYGNSSGTSELPEQSTTDMLGCSESMDAEDTFGSDSSETSLQEVSAHVSSNNGRESVENQNQAEIKKEISCNDEEKIPDTSSYESEGIDERKSLKILWTRCSIRILLDVYRQCKPLFSNQTKGEVWRTIAKNVTAAGFPVTSFDCDKKFRNMIATYKTRKAKDLIAGSNNKVWEYYDVMDELLCDIPKLNSTAIILSHPSNSKSFPDDLDHDKLNNNEEEPSAVSIPPDEMSTREPPLKKVKMDLVERLLHNQEQQWKETKEWRENLKTLLEEDIREKKRRNSILEKLNETLSAFLKK